MQVPAETLLKAALEYLEKDKIQAKPEDRLADIGLDSLDMQELILTLEETCHCEIDNTILKFDANITLKSLSEMASEASNALTRTE